MFCPVEEKLFFSSVIPWRAAGKETLKIGLLSGRVICPGSYNQIIIILIHCELRSLQSKL